MYLGARNPRAKNRKAYAYVYKVFRNKKPKGQK
jgi:hypothetical protein